MSSSDAPTTTVTVRSAADLACVVPYFIGFHPAEGSVVVIAFAHARIVFAARADLPKAGAPAAEAHRLGEHLTPVVRQQQAVTDAVLIGYGEAGHVDPALRVMQQAFTAAEVPIRDLLRVTGTRVFTITCPNPACCPPQGTPFDPAASPVAAQATVAGLVAFPDRNAVAARFAPVDGAARENIHAATQRAVTRLRSLLDAGHTVICETGVRAVENALRQHDAGQRLTDDQVAWLTALLTRTSVRDLAVELTQPHEGHVTFWADVTRRAQRSLAAAPATLLALTAWRCGNGGLAAMAADHALEVNPGYQLAGLLLQALDAGLPPSTFEQAPTGEAH
ncbi:MAG: DUF4192 domain-containing protein [Dactylosporangium sp.]|nr:DUF4192 domain-containing protein [Dactylosporangium sp.]NNJ60369.1 DUF4192 domain-containing protein [Dactylosporangium sp.]